MLEEFRVDNYKSLINIVFRPREMNLFLGLNNSGKTNLCQAIRFAGSTSFLTLQECADVVAGGQQGITNHFFSKPTVDFFVKSTLPFCDENLRFEYSLTLSAPTKPVPQPKLEVETEKLVVSGTKFNSVTLLDNTRKGVRILDEREYAQGRTSYIEMEAPRDATMLNRLYDFKKSANDRALLFKSHLVYWQYYDLSAKQLGSPSGRPTGWLLPADGSNLASVVYNMKTSNERVYRQLLGHLQKLDPDIDLINFQVVPDSKVFMFFEDRQGHSLSADNASNGTLRFLGLIYVILSQPSPHVHPLVIVEEPEDGIYVGFLRDLVELAGQSPSHAQMIFTTHSPYFIDLFDTRIDSIFILKRGEQHSTLHQPDVEKVRARLEQFPLGEQHFREMLG